LRINISFASHDNENPAQVQLESKGEAFGVHSFKGMVIPGITGILLPILDAGIFLYISCLRKWCNIKPNLSFP